MNTADKKILLAVFDYCIEQAEASDIQILEDSNQLEVLCRYYDSISRMENPKVIDDKRR